jgi:hypothetical protein
MFGTHDGIVIVDVPDAVSVAAVNVATLGTGALIEVPGRELLTRQQLSHVQQRAGDGVRVSAGRAKASRLPSARLSIAKTPGNAIGQITRGSDLDLDAGRSRSGARAWSSTTPPGVQLRNEPALRGPSAGRSPSRLTR